MKIENYKPKGFGDIFNMSLGQEIWKFLNTDDIWIRLELTTQLGHPAVEGIGDKLLENFSDALTKDDLFTDRLKQAIGHMVRYIMEKHGYKLIQKGVKCRKKTELFVYASRYGRDNNTKTKTKTE
jgi:hypothetical protein